MEADYGYVFFSWNFSFLDFFPKIILLAQAENMEVSVK